MKINIFNIDDFIKANNCPEVKNPVFFNFDGTPTEDGLFSYDLFGYSDEERKSIFGYIDLKGHYIHPLVYLLMQKKMGSLGKVLTGEKYAIIENKKLKIVEDSIKGAETGIEFIYDHFDEINWIDEVEEDDEESIDKKTRLKFFKSLKRDEFFITKWLVLPPFYRAASSFNLSMGDAINKLYKELLSKTRSMSLGFSFDIFGSETKLRVQNILRDLYQATLAPLSGKNLVFDKVTSEATFPGTPKNSIMQKHILGKGIDWSASSVITSPTNSGAKTIDSKPVPFGYGAYPIASLISMFQPFFLQGCSDFLEDLIYKFEEAHRNIIKKIDYGQFTVSKIESMLKSFIKNQEGRFDPISIEFITNDNSKAEATVEIFEFKTLSDAKAFKNFKQREMTLMDMMFMVGTDVLKDKHIYVTRYPVANFQNIYPSKIKILTTSKVRDIYITYFPPSVEKTFTGDIYHSIDYPCVPATNSNPNDTRLFDVTVCGNAYLSAIGGDYDGDMLYMRGVFTQEANAEAEKLINSKRNLLGADGKVARGLSMIGKDCIMGLYELTKDVSM